ncbi:MAG: phosphate transport system protein [Flavobacteriales bacterium]|jgi:phosphate transport system protein
MTHLDHEIRRLKTTMLKMFLNVERQVIKTKKALIEFDKDLAAEIRETEKRINGIELQIDSDCENILALYSPVAIDLRFVLSIYKMNSDLERLADNVDAIASYILKQETPFSKEIIIRLGIIEMFNICLEMLENIIEAYENEDTTLARKVYAMDEQLNVYNNKVINSISPYILDNPEDLQKHLYLLSAVRKLERNGDLIKNIAEELIFYVEALVLKHKGKNKKPTIIS